MKNLLFFILFIIGCDDGRWLNSQYDYANIYYENATVVSIEHARAFHFGWRQYDIVFKWKYGKYYLNSTYMSPTEVSKGDCVIIKYQEIFKKNTKELYFRKFLSINRVKCE